MGTKRLFRSALHQHARRARRVIGVADLGPESDELAALLATDPAPEVRLAAANRCANRGALADALEKETDVRFAITSALGTVLAERPDAARAMAFLDSNACTDAIRADVVRRTAERLMRQVVRDESEAKIVMHAAH